MAVRCSSAAKPSPAKSKGAGTPILSKIPFLRRLFTNRSEAKDELVLLILVKPTILIEREIENQQFPMLTSKLGS